jgi:hypothetical protein
MRIITRAALAFLLLVGPAVGTALAVTSSQLVELMKAGLGDDVLIALIQTDGSTFQLTTADILALHKQGLSDKVILAMQASSRKTAPKVTERDQPIPSSTQPPIAEPVVREQFVPVTPPQAVNVYQTVSQRVESAQAPWTQVVPLPIAVPVFVRPEPIRQAAPPVYWGWNGQRRPDTWQETPQLDATTAKPATPVKKGGS